MLNKFTVLLLGILFISPLVIYSFIFHGTFPREHVKWAEFGSFLSGVYGTFAFIILAYTTNLTRIQFKIQNEDNVFFKLYESLTNRISNSTILIDNNEYTASRTLKILTEDFEKRLKVEAIEIARILLAESPEKIADVSYSKIFEAIKGPHWIETFEEDKTNFILDITNEANHNVRWEKLKYYIGSRGEETGKLKDALRATGCINFYKIPFEKRQSHYISVSQSLSYDYGDFLDGYLHNISYLIEFAEKSVHKSLYIEFIKSQLTKYEIIIIFYLVAGRYEKLKNQNKFYELGIMDRILTIECRSLMIDIPSVDEVKKELENVFTNTKND